MTVMTRRRFVLAAAVAGVVVGKGVNERGGTGMQADRALRGLAESQCTAEVTSCDSDAACVTCLSDTDINTSGCMEQYPVSEANVSSYCHSLASSICCAAFEKVAADDTGTAECLENELALEYWTCSLEANGCLLENLPCYGEVTIAPVTSLPSVGSGSTPPPTPSVSDTSSAEDTENASANGDSNGSQRASSIGAQAKGLLVTCVIGLAVMWK